MKNILPLLFLFVACTVNAAEWKNLEGIYAVTTNNYLNQSGTEANRTHYRIQLKGQSAEDLYHAISGQPALDDCTGGMAKNAGEMQCLYFDKQAKYECHFSINLERQSVEYGVSC